MPTSYGQTIDPNDLAPGKRLIGGETITSLIKQNNTGQGGLTALAGGGSANTVQITNYITEFTVCASANDSCMLPLALSGIEVTVINSGAQNLRIYAQLSNPNNLNASGAPIADTIIPLGGGAGVGFVTLAPNGFAVFSCPTVGRWKSQNV